MTAQSGGGGREDRLDRQAIDAAIARFPELTVVVVGDLVLDEYVRGDVDRVNPEAPVPIVRVREESRALGGAANTARNVVALGAGCVLAGVVGDDADGRSLRAQLDALGIDAAGVVVEPGRPTTRKTRIVAQAQQLVRFDRETDEALGALAAEELAKSVAQAVANADGAIVSDYAKGVFRTGAGAELLDALADAQAPLFADPKAGYAALARARLVKPNLREARRIARASGVAEGDGLSPADAADALARSWPGVDVIVTEGGYGMHVAAGDGTRRSVPTVAREVYDVQGAGDTAMAALTLARLAGASLREAAVVANAAAAVAIAKSGTATATLAELRDLLPRVFEAAVSERDSR